MRVNTILVSIAAFLLVGTVSAKDHKHKHKPKPEHNGEDKDYEDDRRPGRYNRPGSHDSYRPKYDDYEQPHRDEKFCGRPCRIEGEKRCISGNVVLTCQDGCFVFDYLGPVDATCEEILPGDRSGQAS